MANNSGGGIGLWEILLMLFVAWAIIEFVGDKRKVVEKGDFPTKSAAYKTGVEAYTDWLHGNIGKAKRCLKNTRSARRIISRS